MNSNQYVGNICTDLKVLGENNNAVKFMLAVRRKFKNKETNEYDSDFIPCIAFGNPAKIIIERFDKGDQFAFSGRYQSGSYENNEGKKIYTHDIVVEDITFVYSNKQSGTNNQQTGNQSRGNNDNPFNNANGPIDIQDSDLPF